MSCSSHRQIIPVTIFKTWHNYHQLITKCTSLPPDCFMTPYTWHKLVPTVKPQFYVPAFCVFWNFTPSLYGPDQMSIRTMFPQFVYASNKNFTHFPCSPASSINLLNSSLRSLILFLFSLRSSSARSFTYFSNTCFLSLDVSRRYLGSKTILCSSFSHVLKAETWNNQTRMCFSISSTANTKNKNYSFT